MRRIRIKVAYDGTHYCGWQIQPNGVTIEEVLNRIIGRVTREDIQVIGASRTDSGVHALGNIAVFDTESSIPPERMACAVNQMLPGDIVVVSSDEVDISWHPRYQDHIEKIYEYHIWNAFHMNPMKRHYAAFVPQALSIERMREGAAYLLGEHDFVSFCNVKTQAVSTVRRIEEITIERQGCEIVIRVRGNGFLYHMVRIIAGTLIRVGRGFYEPERVKDILEKKERTAAGVTAPPMGLVLTDILYVE